MSVSGTCVNDKNKQNFENDEGPIEISKLIGEGITERDIEHLKESGFCTVQSIAHASTKFLCTAKGISEVKAGKLKQKAGKIIPTGFAPASVVFEQRSQLVYITTGSKEIDKILNGGIETGQLVEVFGESRTGKTQFCTTLCVTCQLPLDKGGAEAKAIYIDTENTFRPERLIAVAERFGLNGSTVLDNVLHARAYNVDHQNDLLITAGALMSSSTYAIVVIDSATALYRTDYNGRGELAARQMHLNQFLRKLRRLCDEFGVACVYTNQVVSDVSGMSLFAQNASNPCGGHIMAHNSTTKLSFRKGRGDRRVCKVFASPISPEVEAEFAITSAGIDDISE